MKEGIWYVQLICPYDCGETLYAADYYPDDKFQLGDPEGLECRCGKTVGVPKKGPTP